MKKPIIILLLILLLSLALRIFAVSNFPPSLNWDETSLGYNAYSLSRTGSDEWGSRFPTIFRAFGDYKLPGYVYAAVLSEKIFGLNPVGVRLPSVISGFLTVLVSYLLTKKLFHKEALALLLAFLVGINPWTMFLSRIALEANLAALLFLTGIALHFYKRPALSFLFLGLSAWTYNSARIVAPLFVLFFIINDLRTPGFKFHLNRRSVTCALVLVTIFLPLIYQLLSSDGQTRLRWMTLLDSGAISRIESARRVSSFPQLISRLVYNRPTYFVTEFSKNFLVHFSPVFLFISGGSHFQFSIPGQGLIFPVFLPFLVLGLIVLCRQYPQSRFPIFFWLVVSAIPGSLTRDAPHTLRAIFMAVPLLILCALGLYTLLKKSTIYFWLVALGVVFNVIMYWRIAISDYLPQYSWAWQYGYAQMVSVVKNYYTQVNQIIITKKYGEPHEFILFNWPWDPRSYLHDPNLVRYGRSDWFWVDSFAKFRFVNEWDMSKVVNSLPKNVNVLVVASPDTQFSGRFLARINFLDQTPAFIIKLINPH